MAPVVDASGCLAHDLQDAQDRRQIHADATLKKVLGRDQVSMFEMTKLLNQHVK